MGSDYLFDNRLQLSAFRSKDKASLTDSFRSPPKQVLGGHHFTSISASGNAICIQTGQADPASEPP